MKIHSLNLSNGGVPKLPVATCEVRTNGIAGDRQRDRRFHGGPQRAVSLYSLGRLQGRRAEGHPVAPGALGENVTLAGVDWSRMTPGAVVEAGGGPLEPPLFAPPSPHPGPP